MIARWAARVASYDFNIEIRPGIRHGNADGLSRCTQCKREECPADGASARRRQEESEDDLLTPLPGEDWEPSEVVSLPEGSAHRI